MSGERMNPETARLSEMTGQDHPEMCRACGRRREQLPLNKGLQRWQEHDQHDQPEHRVVVLCRTCSNRLIEPHPRLYRAMQENEPWPGCMAICVGCSLRDGTKCSHASAKANGGPGVMLSVGERVNAMVDGIRCGKRTGWRETIWLSPPKACRERVEQLRPGECRCRLCGRGPHPIVNMNLITSTIDPPGQDGNDAQKVYVCDTCWNDRYGGRS